MTDLEVCSSDLPSTDDPRDHPCTLPDTSSNQSVDSLNIRQGSDEVNEVAHVREDHLHECWRRGLRELRSAGLGVGGVRGVRGEEGRSVVEGGEEEF